MWEASESFKSNTEYDIVFLRVVTNRVRQRISRMSAKEKLYSALALYV